MEMPLRALVLVAGCVGLLADQPQCSVGRDGQAECAEEISLAQLRQRKPAASFATGVTSGYTRPKDAKALPLETLLKEVPDYDNDKMGAPFPVGQPAGCQTEPCSSQVHIQLGGPSEMIIVFAANVTTRTPSTVQYWKQGDNGSATTASGDYRTFSAQIYWGSDWLWGESPMPGPNFTRPTVDQVADTMSTYDWAYYGNDTNRHVPHIWKNRTAEWVEENVQYPGMFGTYYNPKEAYTSPQFHTVKIVGLEAGATYEYRVANNNRVFKFKMPIGERPGDEKYPYKFALFSDVGQTAVSGHSIRAVMNMMPDVALIAGDLCYADGYYYRWDTFGNLIQPLSSKVPTMSCPGNHEYGNGEQFQSYNIRYPMPFRQSNSPNPNFWSRNMGPVHLISLNSYSSTHVGSEQRWWVEQDLANVTRSDTPWVVVMMHVPWYNSNEHHLMEGKVMQDNLEELFFKYNVNLVMAGHVHAFEATHPTFKNVTNECGPIYLNTGDAGNYEGINLGWLDGDEPGKPPVWTAFRQSSFGVGSLTVESSGKATYRWVRNFCYDEDAQEPDYGKNCSTPADNSDTASEPDYEIVMENVAAKAECKYH